MVRVIESLTAYGHPNITATHKTTFEITKDEELSRAGTCIIAVGANKGAADLSSAFRNVLQLPGSILETLLTCGNNEVLIRSIGSENLALTHSTDLVWRRSTFTCNRTIGISSDYTALDIPRELISDLKKGCELHVRMITYLRE